MAALKRIGWALAIVICSPVVGATVAVLCIGAGIGVLVGTYTARWEDGMLRVRRVGS